MICLNQSLQFYKIENFPKLINKICKLSLAKKMQIYGFKNDWFERDTFNKDRLFRVRDHLIFRVTRVRLGIEMVGILT